MKRRSWLGLLWLVTIILLFSSCTQDVTEAITTAPPTLEATKTATQTPPPPETKTEIEIEATTTTPPMPEPTETTTQTPSPAPELKPASLSLSGLTITPKEVMAHSPVTIEAMVTNTGELSGHCGVVLWVDDNVENVEWFILEGGTSHKVTFSVTKWMARTYSVSINGMYPVGINEQSGTFVVRPLPLPDMDDFMKGIHFCDWNNFLIPTYRLYDPSLADQSLKDLADTGANWITLLLIARQETIQSTTISRVSPGTATDKDLLHVIEFAHSLGMRVILAPTLYSVMPEGQWCGAIGTAYISETQWQEWFTSYREYINYYATFSQEAGVDLFYVGCELGGTTHREDDWRRVVEEARERYKGPISYDSLCWGYPSPEYKRIKWWDAVDFIAVDCHFSLTNRKDPTIEMLKAGWIRSGYLTEFENLSRQWNKPIIVSEMTYRSFDGFNMKPGDFWNSNNAPVDLQEQADCYRAAFEMLWGKPWLKGMFWWQWSAKSQPWLETPQGKPAEDVIKEYYLTDE